MRTTNKLVAYYGRYDWPSNFFLAQFQMDNLDFNCVEQAYMYLKALQFDDGRRMAAILKATEPSVCKALGRKVEPFNEDIWEMAREPAMRKAMEQRYRQNPYDLRRLLETKDKILVEASKRDKNWGCGFGLYDDDIEKPELWTGLNLHGKCTMVVRKMFQEEQTAMGT